VNAPKGEVYWKVAEEPTALREERDC